MANADIITETIFWQPIETAPKDGRVILLFEFPVVGVFLYRSQWCVANTFEHLPIKALGSKIEPTHWADLPLGPEAAL